MSFMFSKEKIYKGNVSFNYSEPRRAFTVKYYKNSLQCVLVAGLILK